MLTQPRPVAPSLPVVVLQLLVGVVPLERQPDDGRRQLPSRSAAAAENGGRPLQLLGFVQLAVVVPLAVVVTPLLL